MISIHHGSILFNPLAPPPSPPKSAKNLETAFRKNISLTELSMANNNLLNKGVVIILKATKDTPKMQSFNFDNNNLTSDICALFDSMLQQNKVVTHFSFGENDLGTFPFLSRLTTRTFSFCVSSHIAATGDSGGRLIAHGLTFNKT